MLWESSHTGISLEQATNPEISTALVPRAHYPFCTPKSRSPSLPLRIPARMQGLQQPGLPCVLRERGRGRGDGERGGHSWLACPSTDMRHRPCPSGSAFAAVRGLESTTYD